jgi:hypothetical protein
VSLIDAWQAALAAEQQAAFGYTILGAQLPSGRQKLARQAQSEHEGIRNSTAEAIAAHGSTPQAPAGDYPALYPLAKKSPRMLAAQLEDDCAAAWRYLFVAASTDSTGSTAADKTTTALRKVAQARLTASALRALQWRKDLPPQRAFQSFPGID